MKMAKKWLVSLLTLAMLLSAAAPTAALADTQEQDDAQIAYTDSSADDNLGAAAEPAELQAAQAAPEYQRFFGI